MLNREFQLSTQRQIVAVKGLFSSFNIHKKILRVTCDEHTHSYSYVTKNSNHSTHGNRHCCRGETQRLSVAKYGTSVTRKNLVAPNRKQRPIRVTFLDAIIILTTNII